MLARIFMTVKCYNLQIALSSVCYKLSQVKRLCYSSYFYTSANISQTVNYHDRAYIMHILHTSHGISTFQKPGLQIKCHISTPHVTLTCVNHAPLNHTESSKDMRPFERRQIRGQIIKGLLQNHLQEVWSLVTQVAVCTCLVCCSGVSGYSGPRASCFLISFWSGWSTGGVNIN